MLNLLITIFGKADRFVDRSVNKLRVIRLRMLGAQVGRGVKVYGRFIVKGDARKLVIGDGSTINEGVLFDLRDVIVVGRGVRLSSYVQLHTSKLDVSNRSGLHLGGPIYIGDKAWLASGVVVSAGVTIGQGCVIGANAAVIRNLPPNCFAAGLPAKVMSS